MIIAVTSRLLISSIMKSACSTKNENRKCQNELIAFSESESYCCYVCIFLQTCCVWSPFCEMSLVSLSSTSLSALLLPHPGRITESPWGPAGSLPHVAPSEKLGSGWLCVACTCFNRKLTSCLSLTFTPTSISEVVKIALKGERQMEESIQQ